MRPLRKVILFLDFDGTLSPIVKDPEGAVLPQAIRKWLKTLSRRDGVKIAVVTGRTLADIRKKIGIKDIIYAANHGMEISHGGHLVFSGGKRFRGPLSRLAQKLLIALSEVPKVFVEDKRLSVAVHYRRVKKSLHGRVGSIVAHISNTWMKKYGFTLTRGKRVLEVRPAVQWNKGKAVLWIWRRYAPHHLPVYVGDDTTDEDAFRALRPYGVTIRIGKKRGSHAQYSIATMSRLIQTINSRIGK